MQPNVLDEMARQSLSRKLSPAGYHVYGFIVFDKMTIQVCFIKKAKKKFLMWPRLHTHGAYIE